MLYDSCMGVVVFLFAFLRIVIMRIMTIMRAATMIMMLVLVFMGIVRAVTMIMMLVLVFMGIVVMMLILVIMMLVLILVIMTAGLREHRLGVDFIGMMMLDFQQMGFFIGGVTGFALMMMAAARTTVMIMIVRMIVASSTRQMDVMFSQNQRHDHIYHDSNRSDDTH